MASNSCPCKAELASILREEARLWDAADDKNLARAFVCVADRLSPAPAEPQEPLAGWMAKCHVEVKPKGLPGLWSVESPDRSHFLAKNGDWLEYDGLDDGLRQYGNFGFESAARAALLAASEPGVATSTEPPKCMYCDHDLMASEIGACCRCVPQPPQPTKPAPAPFDAEKWVERMRRESGYMVSWSARDDIEARYLTAAHEAGKAEAGQPRPRRWPDGEAEITENKWMLRWLPTIGTSGAWWPSLRREMKPGDYWLPQPPAPPAEKGPR